MTDFTEINEAYGDLFEVNAAIVGFSRKKVADLRGLAELHRTAADGYDELADTMAEMAEESARLIARGIAVEMGLREDDDEDDDDDD